MATAKFQAFVAPGADNKLKVDDKPSTVPGIGPAMESKLEKLGINTVGHLMGFFMTKNLDKESFVEALVGAGVEKKYAEDAAEALNEKARQFCSDSLPEKAAPTAGQTGSLNTFMNGKLSTQELKEGYVPGLGKASVAKLASKGVTSTVQLIGEFLLKSRSRSLFTKLLVEAGELREHDIEAHGTDEAVLEKTLQFCR